MTRIYFFLIYLLLGSLLFKAQSPCSDFNSTTNPQGNWNTAPYPNGNVLASSGSPNTFDNSQYLALEDQSGGSFFINTTDFKNLGQRFLGQCLYFDFYLEKDGNFGAPIHPAIHIMAGDKIITFTANITVTPNSGWVRVRAPIANATASAFPSNAEGTWSIAGGVWTEFNNVMNNSTAAMITPDYTSNIGERVWYDNICIKSCDGCSADFKLETIFGSNTNTASVKLTLNNPILVSTPSSPGSTYTVTWGDGTSSAYTLSALTHTYANSGTYTICVTEKQGKLTLCTRCFTFCYSKASVPSKEINTANTPPQIDIKAIGKAELATNNDYKLVPNPAKAYVDVQTNLSARGSVSVRIIDMSGKTVLEKSETLESGRQNIKLNTQNLIQGSYIVEIKTDNKTNSQKLLISK
ncbi:MULTISPECIES: T9SS type A sorting domain-containing protein [Chryseobacterium]|uniref:T9SS type A sorting domain-containing protein n=1 Tax=Chryseobacterium TaxID=59732 RepID=UPI001BE540FB|nr:MULTISPECIES: T9SS type A sorting domain-containing protein [Chryseobacterium]MBT2622204.1 T9SS type A sorting domain-containing protein [Chryseobacterium sp. ISL-6]